MPLDILFETSTFGCEQTVWRCFHPSRSTASFHGESRQSYYQRQGYVDQVIHIVTRLDRDTTGDAFCKAWVCACSDGHVIAQQREVDKTYRAILSEPVLMQPHGFIDAPSAGQRIRSWREWSGEDGKQALTEYWVDKTYPDGRTVKKSSYIQEKDPSDSGAFHLHRCPLLGDDLYGGKGWPRNVAASPALWVIGILHPISGGALKDRSAVAGWFYQMGKRDRETRRLMSVLEPQYGELDEAFAKIRESLQRWGYGKIPFRFLDYHLYDQARSI